MNFVNLFWHKSANFGDALSPYLLSKFCKLPINAIKYQPYDAKPLKYILTGSLLMCDGITNAIIFGAGFVDTKDTFRAFNVKIKGVRGKRTLKKILEHHEEKIEGKVVIGEPSLCLPHFYKPHTWGGIYAHPKKYKLGIIPHWVDYDRAKELYGKEKDTIIINMIQRKTESITSLIQRVIRQICQCEATISTALHGLIVSVAYNIPTDWCEFSKGRIIGDGFKYYDFLESITDIGEGSNIIKPIDITENKIELDALMKNHRKLKNEKISVREDIMLSEFIKKWH